MNHPEAIEIAESVYLVQVGTNLANAGFVVTTDGVVVVDTGPGPRAGEAIARSIASVTGQPIAYVINTHFHSSHTFGNQAFEAPIVAHAACREQMNRACEDEWHPERIRNWLEENPDLAADYEDLRIVPPSISFSGSGFVHIGNTLVHLIHLGNHTPDSIAVYLPEQRVVFGGDNLFNGRHPFLRHTNATQWLDVLRRLHVDRVDVAVPGHGRAMDSRDLQKLKVYFQSLQKTTRLRRLPTATVPLANV